MARRRSLNRRASRKSLNITELDQNSELVDSRDPLWWKNIEGDMTVRQSRLSYYGDMTEPILNEDSVVSTPNLKKEWWKSLDKTASESPRRISSRKSLRVSEAPSELHYSEGSDESSIKKRKVALRARDKREVETENFMAVFKDSNVPSNGKEKSKGRSEETLASPRRRDHQSQEKKTAESDPDTTVDTSNDTDVVLKPRPKPFKKRFTKISDGSFDNVESPRAQNSSMLQHSSEKQPSDKPANSPSSMKKSPAKLSNLEDGQLMGPPKTTSHRKRLSSISRKLDLSSEESEVDEGSQKKRFGYRKKSRKGVSINPFDKLIGAELESEGIAGEPGTGNEEPKLPESRTTDSRDENFAQMSPDSPIKDKSGNRLNALENQKNNLVPRSFSGENSHSQQIEDDSEDEGENLGSSLARLSLKKKSVIENKGQEGSEILEKQAARSSRSVRLSKHSIDKSVYDLLPQDRSTTPIISDSDGGKEKSLSPGPKSGRSSRISPRNNRSATQNSQDSVEPTILSKSQTKSARKSRGNGSRTRIFSDEDISIEDTSPNSRNEYLTPHNNRDVRKSRISFAANKSHGINQPGESTIENDGQGESISKTINSRLQEHVHKSSEIRDRSITGIFSNDRIQAGRKFDDDLTGVVPAIVHQSISPHLRPFRKSTGDQSHTSNLYDKVSEPGDIDEDAEDADEPVNSSNLRAKKNTRRSRKSVVTKTSFRTQSKKISESEETDEEQEIAQATENSGLLNKSNISSRRITRTSQKTFESQAETNDEPEVAHESIPSNLQSKENTRRSRKSVANKSRTRTQSKQLSEPEETEDEQEIPQEKNNSELPEKSSNSRRLTNESEKTFELEEEMIDEPEVADGSISWHLRSRENTRTSQKSLANKSQTNNRKRRSLESEESEDGVEISQETTNSRSRNKSNSSKEKLTNESQASVETSEENEIHLAPNDATLSGSQSKKKLRSSRKSPAPVNRSQQNVQSLGNVQEDEPEADEETDTRSSSSQIREKSRVSGKSYGTSKNNVSDENSKVDKNPKEIHQKSGLSGVEKKSVTFGKSISTNESKTIESDVNTSEAETEKNYEMSKTSDINSDNDIGGERDVQKQRSTSMDNQKQKNTQSAESVIENEEENVKKSVPESQKSRASKKSLPLAGSRKSFQPLEKIMESEAEIPKKLVTTSTPKSLARPSVSQRNFNSNEIVNKNIDDNRAPSIGKKSINSAGLLKHVFTTPKAKNSRESLLTKNQSANDSSRLNSSNFRSLAADIARNPHSTPLQVQKNITDFFPSKFLQKSNNPTIEVTTTFDKGKLKVVKEKLEEMKKREIESMQLEAEAKKKDVESKKRPVDRAKPNKKTAAETATKKTKVVDKAFIVNGVVYKRPRLPRPKPWVTDRLYRHLWKLMEPKYHLSTRIKSEQFIQDLAKTVALVTRRSQYESYRHEVNKLMKNMAHLGIITTRNDFYDFCYDFLPYDFRVKVTPIMMPGNVLTIPYDPTTLHTPLLREP